MRWFPAPSHLVVVAAVSLLAACGSSDNKKPDAGRVVDDSCGVDCDAQKLYGLLTNNCFEYSSSSTAQNPPALGMWVVGEFTLEGNVKTIQVDYGTQGTVSMTDFFGFPNGRLALMRRIFSNNQSVSYQDNANNIVGAPWSLDAVPVSGTTVDSVLTAALVLNGAGQTTEQVDYRVTATAAVASDLTVPLKTYDTGTSLLFNEVNDHGTDGKRIFAPQVGFVDFSTPLQLSGGTASEYKLQAIRVLNPDAGTSACGTGT